MKKEFKLIDEGKEVADSSDDSFDQYSFLKSSQMIDIMLQKSGSPQSEDAKEDELPAMPVYKADTNYFELYWETYLRNEALMAQISEESTERDNLL